MNTNPVLITLKNIGHLVSKVYWFSDKNFPKSNDLKVPLNWIEIPKITNYNDDYGKIALKICPSICTEMFNLTIHSDGFAVNNDAWTDEFLNYDYIGACWKMEMLGMVDLLSDPKNYMTL
jgi:hypothetical protein